MSKGSAAKVFAEVQRINSSISKLTVKMPEGDSLCVVRSRTMGYLNSVYFIGDEIIFHWMKWKKRSNAWRMVERIAKLYVSRIIKYLPDVEIIPVQK